ncbi:hypothetical protein [Nonomuraea montanisoli]|uniref:hypothetical protein n=1 Tax=Nonomuraea montanisoli TaxID=2741721 RepID=UPI001965D459|nr:hypothetical protein [Nonomuraea montanisoli]
MFSELRPAYKAVFGLAAQAAQHVIKKVCDAYRTLHANLAAGNLGKPGSARRVKAESKPISFRPGAAQPYDDRCLSWQHTDRTVSIWTTAGRLRGVAFTGSARQLALLVKHRKGESDLVRRDGMWFLHATVETDFSGWIWASPTSLGSESRCLTRTGPSAPSTVRSCELSRSRPRSRRTSSCRIGQQRGGNRRSHPANDHAVTRPLAPMT